MLRESDRTLFALAPKYPVCRHIKDFEHVALAPCAFEEASANNFSLEGSSETNECSQRLRNFGHPVPVHSVGSDVVLDATARLLFRGLGLNCGIS